MKKSVYMFSMLLCLLAAATGCSDRGEEPELNILELESANVSFDTFGGAGEIVVKTTDGVTASSAATWCIAAASGNKVAVAVSAYEGLEARYTTITLVSGGKSLQVPVTQSGLEVVIERTAVQLPRTAGSATVKITCRYPITPPQSSATWLTATLAPDNVLEFHVTANPSFPPRTATVNFSIGSIEATITVYQKGLPFTFDHCPGTWTFSHTVEASATGTRYNKTASVVASGDSLLVTLRAGTSPTAAPMFTFTMFYDPELETVTIPVQKVLETVDGDVFLYLSDGGSRLTIEGAMAGTPTGGTQTNPQLTFTNATGNTTLMGFVLILEADAYYLYNAFGSGPQYYKFTNIIMTKQ
jgi:hypothetical protein